MVQLQKDLERFKEARIAVVAISYDSHDVLKRFADQQQIRFPLLSDADSKTIDAYGIRNRDVAKGSRQDGIPHPGTILVDRQGVVRGKLFESVRTRHTTDDLIRAASALPNE